MNPVSPSTDYRLAGLLSLAVLVVGLAGRGDPTPVLILAAIAGINLWIRYSGGPFLILAGITWLLIYPFGIPGITNIGETNPETAFRLEDMIVLIAATVHLQCQFRGLGFARRYIPAAQPGEQPLLRPETIAPPTEYGQALAIILLAMLAAEFFWWMLLASRVDLLAFPPLRRLGVEPRGAVLLDPPNGRVLLTIGIVAMVVGVSSAAFWLWRWATIPASEAQMLLLDTLWRENRRELNRQEYWRAWGGGQHRQRIAFAPEDWSVWRRLRLGAAIFLLVFLGMRLVLRTT
jgi:hypothetical protein